MNWCLDKSFMTKPDDYIMNRISLGKKCLFKIYKIAIFSHGEIIYFTIRSSEKLSVERSFKSNVKVQCVYPVKCDFV